MATDSEAKRRSALGGWQLLPKPDGAIAQGDRQSVAWVYAGIMAGAAVAADIDAAADLGSGKGKRSPPRPYARPVSRVFDTYVAPGQSPAEIAKAEQERVRMVAMKKAVVLAAILAASEDPYGL